MFHILNIDAMNSGVIQVTLNESVFVRKVTTPSRLSPPDRTEGASVICINLLSI